MIRDFTNFAVTQLPEKRLINLKATNKNRIFSSPELFNHFSEGFTFKFIKGVFEERIKSDKNYRLGDSLLKSLTNDRFERLVTHIPMLSNQENYL